MAADQNSEPDVPLPSRNFELTRRVLAVVLVLSVFVPLGCVAGYGYFDYQRRIVDASDIVDRMTRVAQEHALKVADMNHEIGTRIVELLDNDDDAEVNRHEDRVHSRLNTIAADYPQLAAISVFGTNGDLLASSRFFPAPPISIAGREDFRAALASAPAPYFSRPLSGTVMQSDIFTTNMARIASDGDFLGVVSIALKRQYFSEFYADLTNTNPALLVGLYRQDGTILARLPDVQALSSPAPDTPFTTALASAVQVGRVNMISTVDGIERILSFRRVGRYPLYVASGYATTAILDQWRKHFTVVAMLTLAPCIGLWALIFFSLRQLRAEEAAWNHWKNEWVRRASAEASSRQLRRMGALGNLVARVAHDFNNLLMVVAANMELATRKNYTNVERQVTAVKRATVGAQELARRLMSVARKQPLKHEVVDLPAWLASACSIIGTALTEKIDFTLDVAPDTWLVKVDVTELESAILNIAVNARDAMPDGGHFSVRCANVRIAESRHGLQAGEYVSIALSDDGHGMPPAVKEHAFEPLFTTKALGAGTGLGLAQVLATCEQSGGTAMIESESAKGTTLRLFFPRYQGTESLVEPALGGPVAAAAPKPQHVFVVEDNLEVAAGICAVLEVLGCTVRHAMRADEALEVLIGGAAFEFILSDVHLPGKMSGIDFAEQVRSRWPAQKFALMTGYADDLERAKLAGVTVLAKPFNIDELSLLLSDTATFARP
ncbi:hybrid sensor histidine kinase/response regulator [Paraburkholderia dilworthii]|uniref:hybrid sensor histidine kinase/response regulator n=1 Tax=Paraburkholderia dilworthii TaxID=948106 RepID=UPI00048421FF|nr:hybrid sensor histidine kinase/response regulator [Paraburkholderia dilworthii]